ncbi:MAG: hypothetical protein R2854_11650 [Caldilineaceae bacterium]
MQHPHVHGISAQQLQARRELRLHVQAQVGVAERRPVRCARIDLGHQHHVVTAAGQRASEDALALAVGACGVDEVDARVQCRVDEPDRFVLRRTPHLPRRVDAVVQAQFHRA